MSRKYSSAPPPSDRQPSILDTQPRSDSGRFGFSSAEAVVLDVVMNEEHEDYSSTGATVGRAKIQFLSQVSDKKFHYAYPLDSTVQEYPIQGEVVLVFQVHTTFFYTKKLNLITNVKEHQQSYTYTLDRLRKTKQSDPQVADIQRVRAGGIAASPNEESFSNNPLDRRNIVGLKHHIGDLIFQNRYGSSIRFGSNLGQEGWNQEVTEGTVPEFLGGGTKTMFVSGNPRTVSPLPNIILRTYEEAPIKTVNSPFALTMEDIDSDANSIYMLTDQVQKFKLATADLGVHAKSVLAKEWPELPDNKWPGCQILINSNRIILNARKERVIISGMGGVNVMSSTDVTVDSNENFISWIGKDYGLTVGADYMVNIGNDSSIIVERDYKLNTVNEINIVSGGPTVLQSGHSLTIRAGKDAIISGGRVLLGDHNQINNFESIALAETLSGFLGSILMTFIQHSYAVGLMGFIPVSLNPAILAQLVALQANLMAGPPFASTVVRAQRSL